MSRMFIGSVSLALFLLAPLGAAAAERTLEDCFKAALKRSETLGSQVELLNQAEERITQAKGAIFPTISGQVSYFWQDPYNGTVSSPSLANSSDSWRINADQPLFRGFREFAGIRQAHQLAQSQTASVQAAVLQLYQDTSTAFYNLATLMRDLNTVEEELELFEKRISELKQRLAIGRSREAEVLTTQSSMVSLQATGALLRGQIETAREVLQFLTGLERDLTPIDQEPLPQQLQPLEGFLSQVENRPDVKAQASALQAAEENISVQRGQHYPSADLIGNYYLSRSGLLANQQWDLTLSLSVPIFAGGVISSQVRVAASQAKAAELSLEATRRGAMRDIQGLYAALTQEIDQVHKLEASAKLSEKNFAAQGREYRLGLVTNLDVLNALTSFEESVRAFDRARFSSKLDRIRLDALTGKRPANYGELASRLNP